MAGAGDLSRASLYHVVPWAVSNCLRTYSLHRSVHAEGRLGETSHREVRQVGCMHCTPSKFSSRSHDADAPAACEREPQHRGGGAAARFRYSSRPDGGPSTAPSADDSHLRAHAGGDRAAQLRVANGLHVGGGSSNKQRCLLTVRLAPYSCTALARYYM